MTMHGRTMIGKRRSPQYLLVAAEDRITVRQTTMVILPTAMVAEEAVTHMVVGVPVEGASHRLRAPALLADSIPMEVPVVRVVPVVVDRPVLAAIHRSLVTILETGRTKSRLRTSR